jgi:hypothetical protein
MKLIAKVNVKYGPGDGKIAAPGEPFEMDGETAKALMASGSAATPADYEREQRASQPAEDRIAELEAENASLKEQLAAATAKPDGKPAKPEKP